MSAAKTQIRPPVLSSVDHFVLYDTCSKFVSIHIVKRQRCALSAVYKHSKNEDRGLDSSAYLTLRVSKLNEHERNVVLMIDEIYIAKRVEYSGGEVKGLVADGSVASTLLCFIVKSVVGKYKDLVSIYPMSKLTAPKQLECFNEVMTLLRSVLLNVVVISVDNASTNRKFLVDCLCDGELDSCH